MPRKTARRKSKHTRPRVPTAPARRAWGEIVGQAALFVIVIGVPLAVNLRSQNMCDVKDVVLGLGVATGLAAWLLLGLRQGRLAWARSKLTLLIIAYVAWAGASVSYAHYRHVAVSEFGRLAGHLALFLLAIASLRTPRQVRAVVAAACLGSLAVSAYAFVQATGHDFQQWKTPSVRVFSFLGNPTYLGGYLILLLPLALAAGWPRVGREEASGPPPARRWVGLLASGFFVGAALLMALTLYLSYTLSGFIGLGLGAVVAFALVLIRGGRRALRVTIPAGLVAAVVLGLAGLLGYRHMPPSEQARVQEVLHLRDPYREERTLHWRTADRLFQESPLVGKGYGSFRVMALDRMAADWYLQAPERRTGMLVPNYAHNEYRQVLADLGTIGGALFIAMLASAYLLAVWVFLRADQPLWRRLALGTVVAFTAFYFQNFFGITFRQAGASTFFWLWLGLLVLGAASLPDRGNPVIFPRLRELRFRPLSLPGALVVAAGLGLALLVLAWVIIRPVKASVLVKLAGALAARNQFDQSQALAKEALKLCPYSALGYYNLAYAEGQLGDFAAAAEHNKRALELLPGNSSMHYNLGVTYKKLGKYPEAEASFREAVRLAPTFHENHAALAETLLEEGKLAEAWEYTRQALELAPDNPRVLSFAARVAEARDDVAAMLAYQKRAGDLQPTDVVAQQQIAERLLVAERYREALEACRRWIALAPSLARAHRALGYAQYNVGQFGEAAQSFLRAVALDPRDLESRYHLGSCYFRMKDNVNGWRTMMDLARMAPNSEWGRRAQDRIDRARSAAGVPSPRAGGPGPLPAPVPPR